MIPNAFSEKDLRLMQLNRMRVVNDAFDDSCSDLRHAFLSWCNELIQHGLTPEEAHLQVKDWCQRVIDQKELLEMLQNIPYE